MNLLSRALAYVRALPANEPALVGAAIVAGGAVVSTFWPHVTKEQVAGIAAAAALIVGAVQRLVVSPIFRAPTRWTGI